MPYVTAPIWVLGDVIAKCSALHTTSYRHHEWCNSEETHLVISRLLREISMRRSTSKSGTGYRVTWGVPQRVPSSVSASRLCSDTSSWAKCLRNPEDQDDREKGTLSNQPWLTRITPTALLGSWVLQPIKDMTSLGTDFEKHAKWQGSIEEPATKDFVARKVSLLNWTKCKEPTGTQTSAKSTWEIVMKLSSDKQQSAFIHKFGNPLGNPCPSCTMLN